MRGRSTSVAIIPDALGDDFDAGDAVDHDQRGVDHRQHHLGLVDEHVEAGRIEQIDLDLRLRFAPLDESKAGRNRHLAGDFFFVVIGGGRAVVDAAQRGAAPAV
jgi:hypothetical protein